MHLRAHPTAAPRRGATLAMTVICLMGILFITALAIDSGNEMAERRHAQNCADAAALTGCIKLASLKVAGSTPTAQNIKDAVNLSAGHNGYTDGTNCTVTVNWPPASGGFQDANSVELILTFTYNNLVAHG